MNNNQSGLKQKAALVAPLVGNYSLMLLKTIAEEFGKKGCRIEQSITNYLETMAAVLCLVNRISANILREQSVDFLNSTCEEVKVFFQKLWTDSNIFDSIYVDFIGLCDRRFNDYCDKYFPTSKNEKGGLAVGNSLGYSYSKNIQFEPPLIGLHFEVLAMAFFENAKIKELLEI